MGTSITPSQILNGAGGIVSVGSDGSIHITAAGGQPITATATDVRINTGPIEQPGLTGIAVSTAGEGRIYFDSTLKKWRVSEDGGAYSNLVVANPVNLKGSTDCSANPNYPAGSIGDMYYVSVAGKIGGASGSTVQAGDAFVCLTANAGGTQGAVGSSWFILEQNQPVWSEITNTPTTFGGYGISDTSANLRAALTDENGTGAALFSGATSPAFTTPAITTGINDANGNSMAAFTATASSIFGFTLTNAASGGTVALGVTAPTQATAGIAGTPLSLAASNAVAGSGTAGAVAGGSVTIQAGNAARLSSGNANGGNITLTTGSLIGSGLQGKIIIPDTVSNGAPGVLQGSGNTANGIGFSSGNINLGGWMNLIGSQTNTRIPSNFRFGWSSTTDIFNNSLDIAFYRNAAGVVEIDNGTAGQWASLLLGVRDSGTTTVTNGLTVGHQSSGTPAAGLGSAILFNIDSSTTADQNAVQLSALWTTATHASRTADFVVKNVNNAAALAETFRVTAAGNVSQVGKTTTYNNIATVGNGVPSELATIDSTGLTANVAASTLYAVPASGAGLYRVSAYLVTTTAASVSSTMPNAQVVYTDSDSNTSVTLDVSPILGAAGLGQSGLLTANAVGTVFSGTVVVYIKASTTIQYQTVNYASTAAGMAYALRMKLEAL